MVFTQVDGQLVSDVIESACPQLLDRTQIVISHRQNLAHCIHSSPLETVVGTNWETEHLNWYVTGTSHGKISSIGHIQSPVGDVRLVSRSDTRPTCFSRQARPPQIVPQ